MVEAEPHVPITPQSDTNSALADDLLVGAAAIAEALGWRSANGEWNCRRVYHVAAKRTLPIRRVEGLGLCARKSALERFFRELEGRTGDV